MPLDRKIRYAMVGGGPGAFIGAVHRKAAALDGEIELVAGAFSSNAEKSRAQGAELHLDPARVYGSWREMIDAESARHSSERIDFVSIVTPNASHFAIAKAAIEAGFHVVCDKPMTTTREDADALVRLVREHDAVFALTHTYQGYPMVKHARELVRRGALGTLTKIVVEYPQGWLAGTTATDMWRLDPTRSGISSAVGDIGVHAWHLAHYLTGLELESLCADITTFGTGYELEDDASILVHWERGVRGVIAVSQISVGEENGLRIRIYGTKAGLDWRQEHPNHLELRPAGAPAQLHTRGNDYLAPIAKYYTRIPSGHPEGFIEAFANIYRGAARTMAARLAGEPANPMDLDFPTVVDGARGVHFIHAVIESGKRRAWIEARYRKTATNG
jgi:predicted dehydrogenase